MLSLYFLSLLIENCRNLQTPSEMFSRSVPASESFGKLLKLNVQFSRTWKVLERRGFSEWLWKIFGSLFGQILKIS